jgi:hypothetical protein
LYINDCIRFFSCTSNGAIRPQNLRDDSRHESLPAKLSFDHLSNKSFRTAFILDRFSMNCTIMYCSNDLLVSTTSAIGRSFFDFVVKREEEIVRSWITCVKGWGVNKSGLGQPSDGAFGFGRFVLLTEGRGLSPVRILYIHHCC